MSDSSFHPRRRFLGRAVAALATLTVGIPSTLRADAILSGDSDDSEHDAWMTGLKGKHRQFFHALDAQETPMRMASNFLDAYTEAFGAKPGTANSVVGMHGGALPIGLNDAAWVKYALGSGITDPATKKPAVRNFFATDGRLSIEALQKRGILFLLCNTALRQRSTAIAKERGETYETVYEDLKASRLPGVVLVPAMVVAINRAQEAGFTYIRA